MRVSTGGTDVSCSPRASSADAAGLSDSSDGEESFIDIEYHYTIDIVYHYTFLSIFFFIDIDYHYTIDIVYHYTLLSIFSDILMFHFWTVFVDWKRLNYLCGPSDIVFSKDALLSHIRERKRTGIPVNPCLVGRRVVSTAR